MTALLIAASMAMVNQSADYRVRFPLPDGTVPSGWGVNLGFGDITPIQVKRFKEGGFKWVRRDLFWHEVETKKGVYDFAKWDRMMAKLRPLGIRPIMILCYGNGLYQQGPPTTPEARKAFTNYVRAAVKHFRRQGVLWEMWNEPNNHHWGAPPNMGDYMRLAEDVGRLFKAEFPDEWRALPAIAGFDWPWLTGLAEGGNPLLSLYDAVTVHPYRPMEPETVATDYARLRALIGPKKPIFSGEWGYSGQGHNVSDAVQTQYFVRQYLANLASGVPMSIWYNWNNNGPNRKVLGDNFGILTEHFEPKPPFLAAKSLLSKIGGWKYDKRLALASDREWVLLFRKGASLRAVAWTTDRKPATVSAPWGGKHRIDGTPRVLSVPTGSWSRLAGDVRSLESSAAVDRPADLLALVRPAVASLRAGDRATLSSNDRAFAHWKGDQKLSSSLFAKAPRLLDRSEKAHVLKLTVRRGALPPVEQVSLVSHRNPISISIAPQSANEIAVRMSFRSEESFEGTLAVREGSSVSRTAITWTNAAHRNMKLTHPGQPMQAVLLDRKGKPVAQTPRVRLVPVAWTIMVELDGEAKVPGSLSLKEESPTGEAKDYGPTTRIDYEFGVGWRYGMVRDTRAAKWGQGASTLGMWVYGDGSGAELRMRYTDKSGQTFQPDAGPIDWRGWKYVTYSLQGNAAGRWGGMNDGIVYWPIRIDMPVLLDNPGGRGVKGRIYVAAPVVMVEE